MSTLPTQISPQYDVFLSYNREDQVDVRKIATYLNEETDLNPWYDEWSPIPGDSWVDELEEGLKASSTCAMFFGKSGLGPWQKKEVNAALQKEVAQASFRVIPVLLPGAPEKLELPFFLTEQNWVDFRNGLDDSNALRHLMCGIRGVARGPDKPPDSIKTINDVDSDRLKQFVIPPYGGGLELKSDFFIPRKDHQEVFQNICDLTRSITTIQGPRQFGKTSLIYRTYNHAKKYNPKLYAGLVDFQSLTDEELTSMNSIWFNIANQIAYDLKHTHSYWNQDRWDRSLTYRQNFPNFLDKFVFDNQDGQLLIVLDEVDRLIRSPIRDEFFGSIRSFYNRGAVDNTWSRVRWIIGTSSEPKCFIEDLNQSPFNVGFRVDLGPFTLGNWEAFVRQFTEGDLFLSISTAPKTHGVALAPSMVRKILDLTGGHPFLFHRLLYQLAQKPGFEKEVLNRVTEGHKLFSEHLKRFLPFFEKDTLLAKAMKNIIHGKGCNDIRIADRLKAAGLILFDDNPETAVPLCKLYQTFFEINLK